MSEYTQGGARFGAESSPFATGSLRPMFEAAARTGNAYSRAYLSWQSEILRFTSARLQRDAEFGSDLLKCDKWADAARVQQSWMKSTVEDYINEANKLLELATDFTHDVAQTSSDQMRAGAGEARRTASAAAEQAGTVAESMSRFARNAGEQAGGMADEARKAGEQVSDDARKAAEDISSGAKDRGQKRR